MTDAARESQRLSLIDRLQAIDRKADPALQALARLAREIAGASYAGLHIIDERWQRRIAGVGVPLVDEPRDDSFCRLVVEEGEAINVADAPADGRFSYSSQSRGQDPIRFYASVPLRSEGGAVLGTVCAFDKVAIDLPADRMELLADIATQAAAYLEMTTLIEELGTQASQDALTGAVTRLILADRLANHLARLARHSDERELYVAMIDLDGFKQVNDSLGHAAGDHVLRTTAGRLADAMRPEDTVARLGGDEFVVVAEFNGSGSSEESIRARLEQTIATETSWEGTPIRPRGSVGVVRARHEDAPADLLARADRAMYERKPVAPRR